MSCCGKTKEVVDKIKNIVVGISNYNRSIKYEFTDGRIRECQKCEKNTWLSRKEYAVFLLKHGIKVITNITDLSVLPELPKHELSKGRRNLYCQLCKCFIPGKARVEEEKCILNKWDK